MVLEGGEKGGQGNVVGDGERKGKEGINGWMERKDEGKAERERFMHTLQNDFSVCQQDTYTFHTTLRSPQ